MDEEEKQAVDGEACEVSGGGRSTSGCKPWHAMTVLSADTWTKGGTVLTG